MRQVEHKRAANDSLLIGYEYSYDLLGRVVQSVERRPDNPGTDTTVYGYTPAGRLASEVRTGQVWYSRSYEYNLDGSRHTVERNDMLHGAHRDVYAYDPVSGRLASVTDTVPEPDVVHSFVWNPEGTLARWEEPSSYARVFGYDEEGRLVKIGRDYGSGGVQVAYEYGYNSDGARVWKREFLPTLLIEYRWICGTACKGLSMSLYKQEAAADYTTGWFRSESYLITPTSVLYNDFIDVSNLSGHLILHTTSDIIHQYLTDLYGIQTHDNALPLCILKRDQDTGCIPYYIGEEDISYCEFVSVYALPLNQRGRGSKVPKLPEEWQKCLEEAFNKYCDSSKTSVWQIRCIIWAESCDDPNEKNRRTGASGLMQIHPCWFRTPRPPRRKQSFHCTDIIKDFDPFDPCDNITCGVCPFCKVHGSDPRKYGTGESRKYKECMNQKPTH